MKQVRLRSFAKVNLDLRVLHKRPDGFHELRTIFQTVSLTDILELTTQPGRTRIELNSNLNIPDNIIVRAAVNVLETTGKTARIHIQLTKRIPMGGGLGGGSSNAAAMLLALPPLLGKPLPMERLLELAAQLGSDVPFFLLGGTAVGLGRGTELYPLPDLPESPAVVITPGLHVSTADAYRDLGRGSKPVWRADNIETSINDFETVVFRQHPQLKLIQGKLLKLGARPARMSGSGSTLFGIFPSRELRDRAVRSLRNEFVEDKNRKVHPVTMIGRERYRALWRKQVAASLDTVWPPQDRYAE